MSKIVLVVNNNEPRVDSRVIADGLGVDHPSTMRLIKRHADDFKDLGILGFQIQVIKGRGQPEKFIYLNEDQSIFLLALSKNTDKVVKLKKSLVVVFGKYRRQAVKQASIEWQQKRSEGKVARRVETDTIKKFVEYATSQGSKSAKRYYENITRMQYRALFFLDAATMKQGGIRDRLDLGQLSSMDVADRLVARTLNECMGAGMAYKSAYQVAKERLITLGAVVGKCSVPTMIEGSTAALLESA